MQTLIGFYVNNGARLQADNAQELGLFVESYFSQRDLGVEQESFLHFQPGLDKALADNFDGLYTTRFYDPDTQDTADEYSSRIIVFVEASVPSVRLH